jgi:hypothetical protein
MSDTVDNVLDAVNESEPAEVVVEEAPEEVASETEAAEPEPVVEEPTQEPEPEPEPESEPVASASATEAAEPAPVSTQEVVQNVQEILSSTETNVTGDNSELERVKVLEERLEKLIGVIKVQIESNYDYTILIKLINEL